MICNVGIHYDNESVGFLEYLDRVEIIEGLVLPRSKNSQMNREQNNTLYII